jgi:hypothetical protein
VLAADGGALGEVGELHPRVAAAFELPRGVHAFRLSLDALLGAARLIPQYRPIPRLPAVLRDLAVVVDDAVGAASVEAAIREEPLVESVTLFDVYRGPPLPAGRKNLAFAISYRAPDRTLTDASAPSFEGSAVAEAVVERNRLPFAALGFGLAAALSSWNPLAAPFGLVVGLAAMLLAVRALRRPDRRLVSAVALLASFAAVVASAVVLALTAGVGRELGGTPVVQTPGREDVAAEIEAAKEKTRASRERARRELDTLEPSPDAPRDPPGGKR